MFLKFFFNFGRFEPCDSYKLYSYKKESVVEILLKLVIMCCSHVFVFVYCISLKVVVKFS